MKKLINIAFVICVLTAFINCENFITDILDSDPKYEFLGNGSYQGSYFPTNGWRSCAPEEVGMDSDKLKQVYEYAADPSYNTTGILIVKDGYIVGEAYFQGFTRNSRQNGQGMANSFTNALVGIALDKGLISDINNEIYHYFPQWQTAETPDINKRVTIRHLLTMTGGLEWDAYEYNDPGDIGIMYTTGVIDFLRYVLNKPIIHEPGTHWCYSDAEALLFSGILESATNQRVFNFALEHLFNPLGITNVYWESDPAGHTITGWGLYTTVRDFAKFGYLYLNEGQWDGKQIVSSDWIDESTKARSETGNLFGMQWWMLPAFDDFNESLNIPEQTFIALGLYIQRLYIVPEKNLVVVRLGSDTAPPNNQWSSIQFLCLVLDAIIE